MMRADGTSIGLINGKYATVRESYQVVERRIQTVLRDSSERGSLGSLVEFHDKSDGRVVSFSATLIVSVRPRMENFV